jgi:hypothetical protein
MDTRIAGRGEDNGWDSSNLLLLLLLLLPPVAPPLPGLAPTPSFFDLYEEG